MGKVNLYYLLPESSPNNVCMLSNADLQNEENIVQFMNELEAIQHCIRLENYIGFFDSENVTNFLEDFETLEDFYPNPVFNLMRKRMQMWYNWRDQPFQIPHNNYILYGQAISDHTFPEIAEHQHQNGHENFVLVNHLAHNCPSPLKVTINNTDTVDNDCVSNANELFEWFANNRLPVRNFQIIEKHGENRREGQMWHGRWASPLRCSQQEAVELLKRAIGDDIRELFNRDPVRGDYYILFKYEGDNPQNMYHGYHAELNSIEVPQHLKDRLN